MQAKSIRWWITWFLATMFGFMIGSIPLFVLYEVIAGFFVSDVVAFMEKDGPFISSLTIGFAGGGAGIGLMQWLHFRKHTQNGARWIALMAMSFGTVGLTFGALFLAFGEAHLDTVGGRFANELAHNLVAGMVLAWGSWAWFGRPHGVDERRWVLLALLSFTATGMTVWGLESVFSGEQSDFSWLGMFVMGAFAGAMWWPIVRPHLAEDPPMQTGGQAAN